MVDDQEQLALGRLRLTSLFNLFVDLSYPCLNRFYLWFKILLINDIVGIAVSQA